MKAIISPAKNMKKEHAPKDWKTTTPVFLERTKIIKDLLCTYQPYELGILMKVNDKIAMQAYADYQDMNLEAAGAAAGWYYDGLVFKQIPTAEFTTEQIAVYNQKIRILSGFYGILSPLDGIQPYRLEMQCKVPVEEGNLYQYWKDDLYRELYKENEIVINLASEEYAKCIRTYITDTDQFIDIEFTAIKNGKRKNITAWAKMARGQMVRYIVENQIQNPEAIKEFEWNGYHFNETTSAANKFVFIKD